MCVLTIKRDENLLPIRAKSRIVVLGNHEDRVWTKSEKYAPVLRADSLRYLVSMAVENRRLLKQGDCKNAFCNGDLPKDEITIVRPPNGDPSASKHEFWLLKKTLYGLRRSPRHWYDKIDKILRSMGLKSNPHDPCVYSGFVCDPDDPAEPDSTVPLTLGLYVDDFVYFSCSDEVEARFQRILSRLIKVEFMGVVEWFLGTHFAWRHNDKETAVHLNQAGFSRNLVERFNMQSRNINSHSTPYRSGQPIDSIKQGDPDDHSPAQENRTHAYQSLVGSIGWLTQITRPDLAAVHSFLASYTKCPSPGHMKSALYALQYIHSTHDYGVVFTSKASHPMHTYLHQPHETDLEAFTDAVPPTAEQSHRLTAYTDANWGSQMRNAVPAGTPVPLFKFRSMSGAIILRMSGPISWKTERQQRTSLSSCEAEINATNMGSKLTVAARNFTRGFEACGVPVPSDISGPTKVFNDNSACVLWSHNMTLKAMRHIELRENSVREWVQDKSIKVSHVAGIDNVSDIFTKKMRNVSHFCRLRDSFMSRLADFNLASRVATAATAVWC